jgi:hypothetical protein
MKKRLDRILVFVSACFQSRFGLGALNVLQIKNSGASYPTRVMGGYALDFAKIAEKVVC